MTLVEAYKEASSKGHEKEFSEAFYLALNSRKSEQEAIAEAMAKIHSIPSVNETMRAKDAYSRAFQQAIDDGKDENQARIFALQSVPRRK